MSRPRRILDDIGPPGGPSDSSGEGPIPGMPPPDPTLPKPWVCYAILAGAVGLFLAERLVPGLQQIVMVDGRPMVLQPLALYGPVVQRGEYWRLLGVVFEHGGAIHLLFNMSVVVTLGFSLERGIGSARFLGISLVTALGASACSLFFNFNTQMVGASGMILGWAGAMLPVSTQQGRRDLGVWLLQVAVISLLPGVSWSGHLGGFLAGLPCGLALRGGRQGFARAIPFLLFVAAVVAVIAAHPERRGGP